MKALILDSLNFSVERIFPLENYGHPKPYLQDVRKFAKALECTLLFVPWLCRVHRNPTCSLPRLVPIVVLGSVHLCPYSEHYKAILNNTIQGRNRTEELFEINVLQDFRKCCPVFFPKKYLINQVQDKMVPGSGTNSNPDSLLLAEWNRKCKGVSGEPDCLPEGENIDELFDILAEWDTFLKEHVPYFQEVQP